MASFKRFVHCSVHLTLMGIIEDCTTLMRQEKFENDVNFECEDDILGARLGLLEETTHYGYHHLLDHPPDLQEALVLVG